EALDLAGHHRCLAAGDALEQIGVGDEGDALPPRTIAGREVAVDVVLGSKQVANDADQLLADDVRLLNAAAREGRLIEQDLAPYDFMDPGLIHVQLAQRLGQLDGVAAGNEKVGERCSIVTCPQASAIPGMMVAAVAPEPITTTCLP